MESCSPPPTASAITKLRTFPAAVRSILCTLRLLMNPTIEVHRLMTSKAPNRARMASIWRPRVSEATRSSTARLFIGHVSLIEPCLKHAQSCSVDSLGRLSKKGNFVFGVSHHRESNSEVTAGTRCACGRRSYPIRRVLPVRHSTYTVHTVERIL